MNHMLRTLRTIRKPACLIVAGIWMAAAPCAHAEDAADAPAASPSADRDAEDSRIEQELQRLNWKQFRSVIESIPKLKADVEAYGPLGWEYVRANYSTYGWKKNIGKLDETQKQQLAELIRIARATQ